MRPRSSEGGCSMETSGGMKTEPLPIPARWNGLASASPLLLKCINPVASTAPELLDAQPIVNALLAIYCVHPKRFLMPTWTLPKHHTHSEIQKALTKAFNIWRNDQRRALRYKRVEQIGQNKTKTEYIYIWPMFELGLKSLVPTLPEPFDPRTDMDPAMMRDPSIEAFLRSVAFLLSVVTRKR